MLSSLGRKEIESILAEQGQVEVGCDFCGAQYRFDPVDAAQVFVQAAQQPPGSGQEH
jgi:molecular chaperone Hsp33